MNRQKLIHNRKHGPLIRDELPLPDIKANNRFNRAQPPLVQGGGRFACIVRSVPVFSRLGFVDKIVEHGERRRT